jgi:hypothetical protein
MYLKYRTSIEYQPLNQIEVLGKAKCISLLVKKYTVGTPLQIIAWLRYRNLEMKRNKEVEKSVAK